MCVCVCGLLYISFFKITGGAFDGLSPAVNSTAAVALTAPSRPGDSYPHLRKKQGVKEMSRTPGCCGSKGYRLSH